MRTFHKLKNHFHCPIINLDKIWSLIGEEVRAISSPSGGYAWQSAGGAAWVGQSAHRVAVAHWLLLPAGTADPDARPLCPPAQARVAAEKDKSKAPVVNVTDFGYFKVLGKGQLPAQPIVVKAKFISKMAEKKIKEVGGAVELVA